jgi:thymidine phosphorylase
LERNKDALLESQMLGLRATITMHGSLGEGEVVRYENAVLDAIETKKFGGELSEEVIRAVVAGYTEGAVPDYQMASLLMAIFIRGMGYEETLALTRAMADSGERYSFPECVDKHSTGGVGDKVSLTALPIVATCGAPVAKLSGRGLGTTGGTIDKLESIPGFAVDLSEDRFRRQVEEVGLAIIEAGDLAPADKVIYSLRDTTGTVDSLPLIGSSIVSKKVATGAGHLLYDVKRGSGAFMKTTEDARELAELLVRLSEDLGIKASALITDMDNPLGSAIGNALEVRESVRFLMGDEVPEDLSHEARYVAFRLLELKGIEEPAETVENALSSGAAYEKFGEFVRAQGGDAGALEDLVVSNDVREVVAPRGGYVARFGALGIGRAALTLGAGRQKKGDEVDPGAGVEVLVKVRDRIEEGEPVARLYGGRNLERAETLVREALELSDEPVESAPGILDSL